MELKTKTMSENNIKKETDFLIKSLLNIESAIKKLEKLTN